MSGGSQPGQLVGCPETLGVYSLQGVHDSAEMGSLHELEPTAGSGILCLFLWVHIFYKASLNEAEALAVPSSNPILQELVFSCSYQGILKSNWSRCSLKWGFPDKHTRGAVSTCSGRTIFLGMGPHSGLHSGLSKPC